LYVYYIAVYNIATSGYIQPIIIDNSIILLDGGG
jgi:hypothetical protein